MKRKPQVNLSELRALIKEEISIASRARDPEVLAYHRGLRVALDMVLHCVVKEDR